jgi:hypothetical protein
MVGRRAFNAMAAKTAGDADRRGLMPRCRVDYIGRKGCDRRGHEDVQHLASMAVQAGGAEDSSSMMSA